MKIGYLLQMSEYDYKKRGTFMSETKKCKHCQSDIPKKAKVCPVCRKKQKHTALGIFLFIVGLLMMSCSYNSMWNDSNSANQSLNSDQNSGTIESLNDEYITLEEFNQIETGMTYEEVVEIVGSEGTVMSEVSVLDSTTTMYSWYAENGISNANVTITDNKVVGKAQLGLE